LGVCLSSLVSLTRKKISFRWLAFLIVVVAVVVSAVLLKLYGTVPIEEAVTSPSAEYAFGLAFTAFLVAALSYSFWNMRFPQYNLEYDYNSEVEVGRKKGEFTFNLEGRVFHGVDCGGVKIVLLQGTPANHEKKVLVPQRRSGTLFTIQNLSGRRMKRLVLRGIPITDANLIVRLGWLGDKEMLANTQVQENLKRLITSASWSSTVWIAPNIPDTLYQQFIFQEKTLAQIETTFEGRIDNLTKDYNDRVEELKNHYMQVSMDVFFSMVKSIRTVIGNADQAILIVLYLLGKRPKEVEDALSALHLEGGTEHLRKALSDKVAEFEELRDMVERLNALFGPAPQPLKEEVSALKKIVSTVASKVKSAAKPGEEKVPVPMGAPV
jgi:hypothetical protein